MGTADCISHMCVGGGVPPRVGGEGGGGVSSPPSPNIAIYFNSALQSLFPTFPYKFNSRSSDLFYWCLKI